MKKFETILKGKWMVKVIAFALILVLSGSIVACNKTVGLKTFEMPGAQQDTSYMVYGNGTSTVQYGNYVYYINGYRGYDDEDGKQNDDVKKGGLYRAELWGNKSASRLVSDFTTPSGQRIQKGYTFDVQTRMDAEYGSQAKVDAHNATASDKDKWYDADYEFRASRQIERLIDNDDSNEDGSKTDIIDGEKYQTVVDTNRLSNKTVGTSGYKTGGLWVFDDYIYYATPSNARDKSGKVVYEKTEYYRVRLDGKKVDFLYRTDADSKDTPYGFYKQDGKVYLVCQDGTNIVSVATTSKKIDKPLKIAENVTSVVLGNDKEYYDGYNVIDGNRKYTANDYVFFTRNATKDDTVTTGNLLEMVKPSGESRVELYATGGNTEIASVQDGLLFYKDSKDGQQQINYTNLTNDIKNPLQELLVQGTLVTYGSSEFDNFYSFRTAMQSNGAFCVATNASGLTLFNGESSRQIYRGTATVLFVEGQFVYFLDVDGFVSRARIDKDADNQMVEKLSEQAVNKDSLIPTKMGEYIVYIGKVNDRANNYSMFKRIPPIGGETQELFVGEVIDSELGLHDATTTPPGEGGN
ncbi:MAG: hypothetical protein FWD76_00245 [Firmicutes bacterium]|nr:hypothetical protein [Bacillota bacterium]